MGVGVYGKRHSVDQVAGRVDLGDTNGVARDQPMQRREDPSWKRRVRLGWIPAMKS